MTTNTTAVASTLYLVRWGRRWALMLGPIETRIEGKVRGSWKLNARTRSVISAQGIYKTTADISAALKPHGLRLA